MKSSLFLFLTFALVSPSLFAQEQQAAELIRERLEGFGHLERPEVEGIKLFSNTVLPRFYRDRGFTPAWTDAAAAEALKCLRAAGLEGLSPNDYYLPQLEALWAQREYGTGPEALLQAKFDLLLTDALLLYATHLFNGKVRPQHLEATWNFASRAIRGDTVEMVREIIESGAIAQALDTFKPQHPYYGLLKQQLAYYRGLQKKGGWQKVPDGETLRLGMEDRRVPAVRQRLVDEGIMHGKTPMLTLYDSTLAAAVAYFQLQHGLQPDSALGKSTLQAMNVPLEARVDQIRVNLERCRWVLGNLPGNYVMVNIPEYKLFFYREGKIQWQTDVVVGRTFTSTPTFRSAVDYLVFNPTWTVPPGILTRDVLPGAKKDPDYLTKKGLTLLDREGNVVDPASVDWKKAKARGFSYTVRQPPGRDNSLGVVKFMFPNPYSVYLHDTPSKSLFGREERAFSSGCVRVKNPLEFARLLLNEPQTWTTASVEKAIEAKKTQTVFLKQPVDILLLYFSARADSQTGIRYFGDVYQRDGRILALLDTPHLIE